MIPMTLSSLFIGVLLASGAVADQAHLAEYISPSCIPAGQRCAIPGPGTCCPYSTCIPYLDHYQCVWQFDVNAVQSVTRPFLGFTAEAWNNLPEIEPAAHALLQAGGEKNDDGEWMMHRQARAVEKLGLMQLLKETVKDTIVSLHLAISMIHKHFSAAPDEIMVETRELRPEHGGFVRRTAPMPRSHLETIIDAGSAVVLPNLFSLENVNTSMPKLRVMGYMIVDQNDPLFSRIPEMRYALQHIPTDLVRGLSVIQSDATHRLQQESGNRKMALTMGLALVAADDGGADGFIALEKNFAAPPESLVVTVKRTEVDGAATFATSWTARQKDGRLACYPVGVCIPSPWGHVFHITGHIS